MLSAEIVSIGTELLLGQITDTDAPFLSRRLSALGIAVYHRTTVGDNRERALATVLQALSRADVVLLIGGLGPTMDDLTRDILADATNSPLVRDPALVAHLTAWFAAKNYAITDVILRQADVPTGAVALPNANGTAPGLFLEKENKVVIALPGPPNELEPMFDAEVLPLLTTRTGSESAVIASRTVRVVGMGESDAEALIADLMNDANPTVAPYAKLAEVHLRVTSRAGTVAEADALNAERAAIIRERLGDVVYGEDDTTLEDAVVALLKTRRETVAVAESCTGGMLAGRITNVSGSSEVFSVGLITYANDAKITLLQIPRAVIGGVGAVSPEVAKAMASRVRELSGATYGLSTTGIAGPGGGTDAKPVGLVHIGLATPTETVSVERHFPGGRADVRYRATQAALDLLRRELLKNGAA